MKKDYSPRNAGLISSQTLGHYGTNLALDYSKQKNWVMHLTQQIGSQYNSNAGLFLTNS